MIWIPILMHQIVMMNYYGDAMARSDMCWTSFASLIPFIIILINCVNIPYIVKGYSRAVIYPSMALNVSPSGSDEEGTGLIGKGNRSLAYFAEDEGEDLDTINSEFADILKANLLDEIDAKSSGRIKGKERDTGESGLSRRADKSTPDYYDVDVQPASC